MNPANPEYLATLATIQQHAGLYDDASESYALSVKYDPNDPDVWLDFSAMHAELDEYGTALQILELGISAQPDNLMLQIRKVAYLYLMGKPKKAYDQLNNVLAIESVNLDSLWEYAPFLINDTIIMEMISDRK